MGADPPLVECSSDLVMRIGIVELDVAAFGDRDRCVTKLLLHEHMRNATRDRERRTSPPQRVERDERPPIRSDDARPDEQP